MGRHSDEGKNGNHPEPVSHRLPKCVVPVHYDLTFQPEEKDPVLHGNLKLRVEVLCETGKIVMNGLDMKIDSATFVSEDGKKEQVSKDVFMDEKMETIEITFPDKLQKGFGTLALNFEATITDFMRGLYRTKAGDGRYNFITHFEPVHARRCFPGFDEPAFKATFDITLIVPKDRVAISNMPVEKETVYEKAEGFKVLKYQRTPKMSTYLIAMVIGDFEHLEKTNKHGTLVRIFTPPNMKDRGEFSLNLASNLLEYYTEYFNIPYPLPKLDLVAIQEFPIGGMENYGLITFIDTRLLIDPVKSSAWNKQLATLIVSHEVSHLWFGDLVTMKFWTDLWLKEGFAKFMEHLASDHFFPEFDLWTQFLSRTYHTALHMDSLKNSHPVEVFVNNPSEIDEIFDSISYNKGASIIKMMYTYIGDADFRKGMNIYLEKFKFANAETLDLWDALETATGKPVSKFMNTFTKQMGYPLVTVVNVTEEGNAKTFHLKQEKFWIDPSLYTTSNDNFYKWVIPLTYCEGSEPSVAQPLGLFDGGEGTTTCVTVTTKTPGEWVKINAGSAGFYRVRYSSEMLAQFTQAIKEKSMSPSDRLDLLDDLQACVKAGLSSTSDLFKLLEAYTMEDNYAVWSCIRSIVSDLGNILLRTDLSPKFNEYCINLFKPVKTRLGWESKSGEHHTHGLLRAMIISRLINHGDPETIAEAESLFHKMKDGESVSPELRIALFQAVLLKGNSETLDMMIDEYRKCEVSEDKSRYLQSLGWVPDIDSKKKVLDFGLSSEVKLSDIWQILQSLVHTKEGQNLVWDFFKENIKHFQEKYPGGMLIVSVLKIVTDSFVGEEFAQDIETFMKKHPIKGTERTVQQIAEQIRINSSWLQRDFECISKYLK